METRDKFDRFEYQAGVEPQFPCWDGLNLGNGDAASIQPQTRSASVALADDEVTQRTAAEVLRSFEAGRARGIEEGRTMEHEAQAALRQTTEKQRAAQATQLATHFSEEREQFFHRAEQEVVKLALAIASRVLRREAQMDPLLLTGAVRVALGQLSDSTQARLRVPAADLDLWTETMARLPNLALKPAVVADDGMHAGDCVIESSMGSADLAMCAQLLEIERSLFDQHGENLMPVVTAEEEPRDRHGDPS
jgi:flagellar assembly protein FliH